MSTTAATSSAIKRTIKITERKFDRKFTEQKEILNDIWLFDRIRILNLLKEHESDIFSLKSFEKVVEKIIEYQEDII